MEHFGITSHMPNCMGEKRSCKQSYLFPHQDCKNCLILGLIKYAHGNPLFSIIGTPLTVQLTHIILLSKPP